MCKINRWVLVLSTQLALLFQGAINNLDKQNNQEFLDNKWLLREVSINLSIQCVVARSPPKQQYTSPIVLQVKINRAHIAAVEADVERLEKDSIKVMADLFEQQLEDVTDTRWASVLSSFEPLRRSVYAVTRFPQGLFIFALDKYK